MWASPPCVHARLHGRAGEKCARCALDHRLGFRSGHLPIATPALARTRFVCLPVCGSVRARVFQDIALAPAHERPCASHRWQFEEIFNMMGGGGGGLEQMFGGGMRRGKPRTRDSVSKLRVRLEEFYNGGSRTVSIAWSHSTANFAGPFVLFTRIVSLHGTGQDQTQGGL